MTQLVWIHACLGRLCTQASRRSAIGGRRRLFVGIQPDVHPILSPQLDWMLSSIGTVTAAHVISRTEVLASPADAFRVARTKRNFATHDEESPHPHHARPLERPQS